MRGRSTAPIRRLFRRARRYGLGITVHTGESGPIDEVARVIEMLEPDRIGHGVKSAYDPRAMAMLRDRGITLVDSTALLAPRNLNEQVRCKFSHLSQSSQPNSAFNWGSESTGVVRTAPLILCFAEKMSAIPGIWPAAFSFIGI